MRTIRLGDWNNLEAVRFTAHGAYLDGGEIGEILLPRRFVKPSMKPGDRMDVFVYLDQQERLTATTETPLARVGDFAFLRVAWTNRFGAFLDWGLQKDLFVPFREQRSLMAAGEKHLVRVYVDEQTQRIAASAKVEHFLRPADESYCRGREVEALIWQRTPLGFKAIVDNAFQGLLYADQTFRDVRPGERTTATVTALRPDGKLDLSLQKVGVGRFRDFADELREALEAAGGELPFSDESPAELIRERFGVSKKTFKQAIGVLYKRRVISLGKGKIVLNPED